MAVEGTVVRAGATVVAMVMAIPAGATRAADFMEVVGFAAVADSMAEGAPMEAVGSTAEADPTVEAGSMVAADSMVVVGAGNALPRMKRPTADSIELPAVSLSHCLISSVRFPGFGCPALYPAPAFLLECRLANRRGSKMSRTLRRLTPLWPT
jgi:hypothetical protein